MNLLSLMAFIGCSNNTVKATKPAPEISIRSHGIDWKANGRSNVNLGSGVGQTGKFDDDRTDCSFYNGCGRLNNPLIALNFEQ